MPQETGIEEARRKRAEAYGLSKAAARAMVAFESERGNPWPKHGGYPYIAMSWRLAQKQIESAVKYFRKTRCRKPETFIELGCGFGVITHWVQTHLKLDATGVDIEERYIKKSKQHLEGRFRVADVLKLRNLSKFDIIYFYQPLYVPALVHKFNRRVAKLCGDAVVCPNHALTGSLLGLRDYEGLWDRWSAIEYRENKKGTAALVFKKIGADCRCHVRPTEAFASW